MFGLVGAPLCDPAAVYYFKHNMVFLIAAILACIPWKQTLPQLFAKSEQATYWLKPLAITAIFLLALGMIVSQSYNPFLYFRF